MRIPFSYIWRSLWARRLTTTLTLGGVALVVFVFAGVLMLARGLEATLVDTGSPQNAIVLRRSAGSELVSQIDRGTASVLETQPEVALAKDGRPLLSREGVVVINLYKKTTNGMSNVVVRGVSPQAFELRPGFRVTQGRPFQFGTHEIVVGKNIADRFKGVAVGAELSFGGDRWTVVGIADAGGTGFDSEIWGGRGPTDASLRPPRVFVRDVSPARSGRIRRRQGATPGRSALPVSGAQARAGLLPRAVASDGEVHQDPRPRRDHHLQRRSDDRRDDHDVRRGREPGRRSGDPARLGVPAPQRADRVPGRVGAARDGRRSGGRRARLAAVLRAGLDPQLRELLGDRLRVRAVARRHHERAGLRRSDGRCWRLSPGGAGGAPEHRQRAAGVVAGEARAVKLTPLAAHTPEAVRAALAARGWDAQPAWFAATGMQALVVLLEEITEAEREALVRWGAKGGADVLTGEGWALVGAAASRLAPLARSDRLPPGLERLAPELGRFLASYVDPPRRWALGGGSSLDLDHP